MAPKPLVAGNWKMNGLRADAAEAWRQVHLLKAETSGPDGFATWKDAATDERVRRVKAEQEAAKLRADAGRWRTVSAMMTHEHRADAVGWTLGALLPGDDPDAAIDAARVRAPDA